MRARRNFRKEGEKPLLAFVGHGVTKFVASWNDLLATVTTALDNAR